MANPTSNYGWVLPNSADLVTDLPADFDVALQGVDTTTKALNPSTTLGDIEYRSATANTNTRLPIGTTGQVLTVAGGVPSWATASAGGMTSIASGSLTGGTVSLTSIAGTYKDLVLVVRDYYFAAAAQFRCQFNTNTGSVYWNAIRENDHTNATVTNTAGLQTSFMRLSGSLSVNNADNNNVAIIQINDYANATSNKLIQTQNAFIDSSTNRLNVTNDAVFNNTTAISSIQIFSDGSTFSGGTYILYGVS
jgi:hypothetical protein